MKALVLGLCSTGCSLVLSRAPAPPRIGAPPCKVSRAPAFFDAYQATGGLVLSLWALGEADGSEADAMGTLAGVTLAVSAAYAASAAYGFANAARCRDQHERLVWVQPVAEPAAAGVEIEGEVERVEEEETVQRRRTIYMRRGGSSP